VQNRNSPLEVKPFVFKGSLTPSNLPRKITNTNLNLNSYDIKLNSNTIPDFKDKEDPPVRQKMIKNTFENHFKSKFNQKRNIIDKKLNKSNHDERIRTNKNTLNNMNHITNERRTVTSMSTRFQKNIRKNINSDNVNSILSIPYLNNNPHSVTNVAFNNNRKNFINLGFNNMNVFNNPGMYVSLPFLMENRGELMMSRNLLVDQLKLE